MWRADIADVRDSNSSTRDVGTACTDSNADYPPRTTRTWKWRKAGTRKFEVGNRVDLPIMDNECFFFWVRWSINRLTRPSGSRGPNPPHKDCARTRRRFAASQGKCVPKTENKKLIRDNLHESGTLRNCWRYSEWIRPLWLTGRIHGSIWGEIVDQALISYKQSLSSSKNTPSKVVYE